jgi:hypothetical protein
MDDCRLYVCRPEFGQNTDCIRFKSLFDYYIWRDSTEYSYLYSYQPICNKIQIFDKLLLQYRNCNLIKIK